MYRRLFSGFCMVFFCLLTVTSLVSAEILETPHFLILYPAEDAALAETIADTMEKAHGTLTAELGVDHVNSLKIKLVPVVYGGKALYRPDRRTIEVLTTEAMTASFGGKQPSLRFIKGVLWHEYVHFLQHQVMKRFIKDRNALWFVEGTAEYLGTTKIGGRHSPEAVWKEGETILSEMRLPTLEELNLYLATRQFPLVSYFFSCDAVAFLVHKGGMEAVCQITEDMGTGEELSECLFESLGIDLPTFESEWHRDLEERYRSFIKNS
jgi:hypothetical protein